MGIDSVFLTGIIAVACNGIPDRGNAQDGCSMGLEMGSKQIGIYEVIKAKEMEVTKQAEDEIKKNIDISTINFFSTTVLLGRVVMGYKTSFRLGIGPLNGDYRLETDSKSATIKIGWDL